MKHAALLLALLCACGGGGSKSSPATPITAASSLSYQNPTAGGGFSLVQDAAASTATQLVLDLEKRLGR